MDSLDNKIYKVKKNENWRYIDECEQSGQSCYGRQGGCLSYCVFLKCWLVEDFHVLNNIKKNQRKNGKLIVKAYTLNIGDMLFRFTIQFFSVQWWGLQKKNLSRYFWYRFCGLSLSPKNPKIQKIKFWFQNGRFIGTKYYSWLKIWCDIIPRVHLNIKLQLYTENHKYEEGIIIKLFIHCYAFRILYKLVIFKYL